MDYKLKIQEKITTFLDSSNDKAIEEFYHTLSDIIQDNRETDQYIKVIIDDFFLNYNYYYINTTDLYVEYTDKFKVITENNMIHIVLLYIKNYHTNTELNSVLKKQIKTKIIKKIKLRNIYQNIPESESIQNILDFLHPNFFNNRNCAKYFMITLGDIIMKKTDLFYFIPIHIKPFIKTINKYVSMYFHTINLCNHYKFQYYDHETDKSRVISFNNINLKHVTIPDSFYNNLICISLHYSNRYNNGDTFLEDPCCLSLKQNVLWIKQISKTDIIDSFIKEYIYFKKGSKINEKDMLFIWKDYIKHNNMMSIFQKNSDFKDHISNKIKYYEGNYYDVSSMFLPYVNDFRDFWSKYMFNDDTEYEFEISEILQLFIEAYKDKFVDEQMIHELIQYYYPTNYINNKVDKIGCTLWNKKKEIDVFLKNVTIVGVNVNDIYHLYCNEFKNKRKVSKNYFLLYYSSL
jgi:hypothetical protein